MSYVSLNLETEYEKIYHVFVNLFKNEPTWASVAETDIAYISPYISEIVTTLAGTSVDTEVMNIISSLKIDLVLATKFIQACDNSKNLVDVLNSIQSNLQGLLTISTIKSSSEINKITTIVTKIISEIKAILTASQASTK